MVTGRLSTAELTDINHLLAGQAPETILRWAVAEFGSRLLMATAFGAEGCCVIDMLTNMHPRPRVINLDTGYQFPETLELRERLKERYGWGVEFVRAEQSVSAYEAEHHGPVYLYDPDRCCHDRKIVPLQKELIGMDAWLSSIRKDQTGHRAAAGVVQWDSKFGLYKVNPLLHWTKRDVWAYIVKHDVPYNPLHDRNFPSIGCWPCTRAVAAGEDERAGRWSGTAKKECGLHVMPDHEGGSGI